MVRGKEGSMKFFILKLFFHVSVGIFLSIIWGINIKDIGIIRWLLGWVIGITLLVDVWPLLSGREERREG
jgi:hypothetical protein